MDSISMGINPPRDMLLLYAEIRRRADLGGNCLPRLHDRAGEFEIPRASPRDAWTAFVVVVVVYKRASVDPSSIPEHQRMQLGHSQRCSGSAR
jgi:hypothetical protein